MDLVKNGGGLPGSDDDADLRRGPWTVEEDFALINYVAHHGEGRWNSLARSAGLKRTGKSCRLRWLNYLRPDVRRGNITLEEQVLILELHSRWGNRWSKIAQHLPGRTDNEIKNYWRTRVQKHAKQLKCDVNSKQFKDTMRYLWMPRLMERIQAAAATTATSSSTTTDNVIPATYDQIHDHVQSMDISTTSSHMSDVADYNDCMNFTVAENSSTTSDSFGTQFSPVSDGYYNNMPIPNHGHEFVYGGQTLTSPTAGYFNHGPELEQTMEQNTNQWINGGDVSDNLWSVEDMWLLQQRFNYLS
ncbi:unnamed protein product [Cuscuta epithymum]|uniref:Uncharacterized protein n=1 Tax=Cuscuta epithymum TaxID=186058 RepID=A0AAV0E4X2_9ASTE|nr:unnamed protein product [Cuscuta epithymum]